MLNNLCINRYKRNKALSAAIRDAYFTQLDIRKKLQHNYKVSQSILFN